MGPVYVMITGLLFSIGGLCIKTIPWNGMAINSFRCILSGTVIWLATRVLHHPLRFNKHILLSALALAATNCLYSSAVKLTTVGAAIVIQFTVPVWTMLFGLILYHKKPQRISWPASASLRASRSAFMKASRRGVRQATCWRCSPA